jgi:3-deoxy-D-manno-octulosonic-acid transferase
MFRLFYWVLLLPPAWCAAWAAAAFSPKVRAGLVRRVGVWRRFRAVPSRRDPGRPLVWVHAASAGEFLQAEPILRRLRGDGAQLAVSLTSVSGLRWLERIADWPELIWGDLLPFDFPWAVRRLLRGLRPDAIVYVQADLWPGLVGAAHARGIPQLLVAARVGSGANYRARPILRPFFAPLYGRLQAVLCTTERDRAGIAEIVPHHPRLEVAGDPGIETVLARLNEAPPPARPAGWDGPVWVAGSSWPADEQVYLPVLLEAMGEFPGLRAVLAPHEPADEHLAALERALERVGTLRLSAWEAREGGKQQETGEPAPRVLLVDSVGRLSSLYRLGSVSYVGGAFGTGVHNVAEPAACGMPVLFGPRHGNSAMAGLLLQAGAAHAVTDAASLRAALWPWLEDEQRRAELGGLAREGGALPRRGAGACRRKGG